MENKEIKLQFRVTPTFAERLRIAARCTDRPAALIARESINEKLDELAERFPQINEPEVAREQSAVAA
jgi:predicted DNA-binding protein